jgi:acyl-CoA reductase-like NAD-dependent aldehyde dehydrogenase
VNVIDGTYIDGGWQRSAGGESITVINPYTEEPIGRAAVSTAAEVDAAVRSAHRAFTEGGWPETPLDERIEICRRVAGLITDRAGELATTASASMGAPYASWRTLGDSAGLIEMFSESVRRIPFEYGLGGAVHSADPLHALRVAERVESGYIAINRFGIGGSGPFGGVKNSGIGRECGVEGFDSFLEYISYPVSADFADDLAKTVSVE